MGETTNDAYQQARRRVQDTPELTAHEDFILADWPEGDDHWQWVATAPVAEVVDWAEAGDSLTGTTRVVSVTVTEDDTMEIELSDVDDFGVETAVSSSTSDQPGVWATVKTDEDLWAWSEREHDVHAEHSTRGTYSTRAGREAYTVWGPVLPQ